jgi:hypothetical protein
MITTKRRLSPPLYTVSSALLGRYEFQLDVSAVVLDQIAPGQGFNTDPVLAKDRRSVCLCYRLYCDAAGMSRSSVCHLKTEFEIFRVARSPNQSLLSAHSSCSPVRSTNFPMLQHGL